MEEKENLIIGMDQPKSLQDSFQRFLKEKKQLLRNRCFIAKNKGYNHDDPVFRDQLREKFIERARHYIGTPYAKRFHEPGDEAYNSPIFLDCCALVRQALYDLREEFGFTLGR